MASPSRNKNRQRSREREDAKAGNGQGPRAGRDGTPGEPGGSHDICKLLIQRVIGSTGDEFAQVQAVRAIFAADVADLNYRVWHWIEEYHAAYDSAPTLVAFRRNFPEAVFRFAADEMPLAALIEEARKATLAVELYGVLNPALDLYDQGEYDRVAKALTTWAEQAETVARDDYPATVSSCDLDTLPDTEPLIEGVLDHRTVNVLGGFSATGKSFIALDWACCIATGKSWRGHKVKTGRCLYIAAEGAYGMKTRVRAWEKHFGTELPRGGLDFLMAPVQFANAPHVARLRAEVRAAGYTFVVIDTQARSTVGLEENSATDMGKFVEELYKLRDACGEAGVTPLVIHHTGYDKSRTRGSSSNFAAVDAEYLTTAPEKDGSGRPDPHEQIELKCTKRKDAALPDPVYLRLEDVDLGGGRSSCVVSDCDHQPGGDTSPWEAFTQALKDAGKPLTVSALCDRTLEASGHKVPQPTASEWLRKMENTARAKRTPAAGRRGDLWEWLPEQPMYEGRPGRRGRS
jgi:AAA domain